MNDKKQVLKKYLKLPGRLKAIEKSGIITLDYDDILYPFSECFKKMLIEKNLMTSNVSLENLHTSLDQKDKEVDIYGFNNVTRSTYETNDEFKSIYARFMQEVVVPFIGEDSYIQKTPTNRFSFPFSDGVNSRFFHTDIMLGHPPSEINIWLPLTKTEITRSFKILPLSLSLELIETYNYDLEELENKILTDDDLYSLIKKNSFYVDLMPGQCLIFDSRCLHGVRKNKSSYARISMDSRLITKVDYDNLPYEFVGSKGTKRQSKFMPGDYYDSSLIKI